jgi:CcmD family protein
MMTAFEPGTLLNGLLTAIQDNPVAAGVSAAEAAVRPDAVGRGLRFLAGAYGVVWTILGAYLVILSFRLRRLARQVRRLRERLGL